MFNLLRFNTAFPNASRQALKGFTGALNFMIMPLLSRHLATERHGKPVDAESMPGNEALAQQDDVAAGVEHEATQSAENGHSIQEAPLVTAGRLKAIYDWCAAELLAHARLLEQKDGKMVPDEFHLATEISNSLAFRANAPVGLSAAQEKTIREKCAMYGKSFEEARDSALATAKRIQLAQRRDTEVIAQLFAELTCTGQDGHALEAEAAFDRLHPVYQERVLAALDKALLGAFNRAADDDMRPNPRPDAAGDASHLNQMRWDVRKVFNGLMKNERFAREYQEAKQQATWASEPLKAIEHKKAA